MSDSLSYLSLAEIQARYQQPSVRDLAWLLLSPGLFDSLLGDFSAFKPKIHLANTLTWLDELDRITGNTALPQRQQFRRLGLYCEALFETFFIHSRANRLSPYRFIARNIQFQNDKRTLGELDFLLEDEDGQQIAHVELATKFFLQAEPDADTWNNWIGPNARDRLDLKLERMIDHQLALPRMECSQDAMRLLGEKLANTQTPSSHYFIKGALFSHPQSDSIMCPEGSDLSSSQGHWLRLSDLKKLRHGAFYLCEKMEWLVPPRLEHKDMGREENKRAATTSKPISTEISTQVSTQTSATKSAPEIADTISLLHERSRKYFKGGVPGAMVVHLDTQGKQSRLMIVPDYWPATNSPSRNI